MMQPIVLRIPEEDRRFLELEAKRAGKPMAEVARKAIKAYLKGKPKQKSAAEVLLEWARKAKKYKNSFKDKDLSANYKEYLYGSKSPKFGYLWKNKK
jgi:predicted DNA-binding protein